jgi:hypothetical protein
VKKLYVTCNFVDTSKNLKKGLSTFQKIALNIGIC